MLDPRFGKDWAPDLEGAVADGALTTTKLPECRLKFLDREQNQVRRGHLVLDKVFCASCSQEMPIGAFPGTVFTFALCEPCFNRMDRVTPPGMAIIPGT